jgi:hypothetical protein
MKPMVLKRGKGIKLVEVEYSLHNIAHRKLFEVEQKKSLVRAVVLCGHTSLLRYTPACIDIVN